MCKYNKHIINEPNMFELSNSVKHKTQKLHVYVSSYLKGMFIR